MSSIMDISLNRPKYPQNLPHSIQEKLSLLSVFESLITNLEEQLRSLKKEHAKLYADVEPYRIQDKPDVPSVIIRNALRASKSPISRCPDEILYLIFQQYIIPEHREISNLLFVCKHWNSVVMNSPGLWARIEVQDATEFFRPLKQSSIISYISACYARSRDILLDVDLSLEQVPYHSGYIACQIEDYAAQIVDKDEEENIMIQISDIKWEYTPRDYDSGFEKFIKCIFGTDGSHIARWASLSLFLPHEIEPAIKIWQRISFPFPNLKELCIYKIPRDVFPPGPFDSLGIPSVERLTIGLAPLDVFQISWDLLTRLKLNFEQKLKNFELVSLLTSLKTLELFGIGIEIYYDDDDTWSPPDPSTWPVHTIQLPQLTELILHGDYESLQAVQFHLPRLDKLTVHSWDSFKKLPILSPPRIQWQLDVGWEDDWTPKAIEEGVTPYRLVYVVNVQLTRLVSDRIKESSD